MSRHVMAEAPPSSAVTLCATQTGVQGLSEAAARNPSCNALLPSEDECGSHQPEGSHMANYIAYTVSNKIRISAGDVNRICEPKRMKTRSGSISLSQATFGNFLRSRLDVSPGLSDSG
jgi:hypothetical protein